LGGAVSEFLSEELPVFVHKIGIEDVFGESGTKDDLFCKHGFTKEAVAKRIKDRLNG
jgi:transketolase